MGRKILANRLFPESCDHARVEYIEGYPVPPIPSLQPVKAAHALFGIYRDIEETSHVYDLFQAVSGKAYRRGFEQLARTVEGRRVLDGHVKIEEILSQRDWLANLPENSVGHRYFRMIDAKNFAVEGLLHAAQAAGIDVNAPTMFEAYRRYFIHFEVTHDLWHVLTGYDTDALGELCLLEFYRAQWPDIGLRLLTWMGVVGAFAEQPSQAKIVRQAVREGFRNGRSARSVLSSDFETLLETPLADARAHLGIIEPKTYRNVSYAVRRSFQGGGATIEGQPEPVFEVGWA